MLKISGLDKLQKDLKDASRALQRLDGNIAKLTFDPSDPASVRAAIRQMEAAVDRKVAPYRANPLVKQVADGMKESYRKAILQQAKSA